MLIENCPLASMLVVEPFSAPFNSTLAVIPDVSSGAMLVPS